MTPETLPKTKLAGSVFALPAAVVQPHLAALDAVGIRPIHRTVTVEPFTLDAFEFRGPTLDATAEQLLSVMVVLGSAAFSKHEKGRIGRNTGPYFCGVQGTVRLVPKPKEAPRTDDDDDDEEEKEPEPEFDDSSGTETYYQSRVRLILERVSRLSGGLNITLHPEIRGQGYPPLPDTPGHINLYVWTSPPGDSEEYFLARAFKLPLDKEGKSVLTYRGVPGRGEFVGDGKHDLVQMVGNNWYVLTAVFEFAHRYATEELVAKMLAVALSRWQALKRGARPAVRPTPLDGPGFVKTASAWINSIPDMLTGEIEKQRKSLERIRREYERTLRIHHDTLRIQETFSKEGTIRELLNTLPAQWRGIRRNPRVARVARVNDGVHVTTVPIIIEHAGARYPVGQFVIRFNKQGVITLWNLERLHPKGLPHPHINEEGHPCYGNASTAIESAMAEHRYVDAVDYLTRWLADGYEPALAQHPVTEWPAEVPHA